MDNERHTQVAEVFVQGVESCRQHINSIRLDNVRHSEQEARQAEQNLLLAQESPRQAEEIAGIYKARRTSWSTITIEIADQSVRNNEAYVRRYEELARQAKEEARWAVEALSIASAAG